MLDSLLTEQGLNYKLQNSKITQSDSRNRIRPELRHIKRTVFPKRSFVNILLIFLTTLQVILIINLKVYLHSDLIRSFLSIYADEDVYPELFDGNAFYLNVQNVSELQQNIEYIFTQMNQAQNESLLNLNYTRADITLQIQYHPQLQSSINESIYVIDPKDGITEPFDQSNITSIQLFLLRVHFFEIIVGNLTIQTEGLREKYIHKIIFHYEQSNQISVSYQFLIDNAIVGYDDQDRPQANFLIFLRVFYLIIIILALSSLYFNAIYIRRVFKQLFSILSKKAKHVPLFTSRKSIFDQLPHQDVSEIDSNILKNIEARQITLNNIKWQHYLMIIEFDVIFSVVANLLQIISNVYLLFGREHQIVAGFGCLLSWMTIFRILRKFQKLILMYQLIKMSLLSVIKFTLSFLIIFMGYTFLGMCLFPKVIFFSSMSMTVTTLASMMAGDSIEMITKAICLKNSTLLAIIYIFSYIILFMHAIHNTLTSLIKEYFILKKLQLIASQKQRKGDQAFMYLQECELSSQASKKRLPLKLTYALEKDMIKRRRQKQFNQYNKNMRKIMMMMENILSKQRWEVYDSEILNHPIYRQQLLHRLQKIKEKVGKIETVQTSNSLKYIKASQLTNQDED